MVLRLVVVPVRRLKRIWSLSGFEAERATGDHHQQEHHDADDHPNQDAHTSKSCTGGELPQWAFARRVPLLRERTSLCRRPRAAPPVWDTSNVDKTQVSTFKVDGLLTVREVGDRLNLSRQSVWRLARTGALPAIRLTEGAQLRFRSADVEALIERGSHGA